MPRYPQDSPRAHLPGGSTRPGGGPGVPGAGRVQGPRPPLPPPSRPQEQEAEAGGGPGGRSNRGRDSPLQRSAGGQDRVHHGIRGTEPVVLRQSLTFITSKPLTFSLRRSDQFTQR